MGGSERTAAAGAKSRGSALYEQGDYAAAESAFAEAIQLAGVEDQAELHVYHSNRCAARQQLGNLAGALEDAQRCTALAPTWAKGWSRLGSCLLQQAQHQPAVEAFRKAAHLEPGNATYTAQMKNAQEVLRRAPPSAAAPGPNASSASAGANASASSGPGVGERLSEWAGARLVAGHRWWSQLTPDQQKLLLAGAALGVLVLLYNLYQAFFGYSYTDLVEPPMYYGGHSGWTWGFWLAVVGAFYQLPPMFGYQPFFGMSFFQVIWLLQMLQGNGGGGRGYGYQRRRRW